ncbi:MULTISPECIES: hypothetical protein [Parafrankia]|uniref:hypothetical protein n=1 Tax=Parafrankia TaxID=2994362 RepID=UPI000B8A5CDC|nr:MULTISPECIES: hypothetical protein [Parafrankia]MBE3202284.1 hypothetical protein [Parafrankia sp. CH37]
MDELLDESLVTAAGRFFVSAWTNPGRLPLAPPRFFVVHLGADQTGFQANGRPVTPETLALVIENCHEWGHRPVLVLARSRPPDELVASLAHVLATRLRVSVHTADTGAWQLPGIVFTAGTVRRWDVPGPGVTTGGLLTGPVAESEPAVAPEPAGESEPAVESEPAPVAMAAVPGPIPEIVPVSEAARNVWQPVALPPAIRRESPVVARWSPVQRPPDAPPGAEVAPPADSHPPADLHPSGDPGGSPAQTGRPDSVGGARQKPAGFLPWIAVAPEAEPSDRERLRAFLGWQYEAHARAVLGLLALQPGLRSASGAIDVLSGLVALRAYLRAEDPAGAARIAAEPPAVTAGLVDAVLRGAAEGGDRDGLLLLARCAAAGLGRLPSAAGPVVRPTLADPLLAAGLRPGQVLVEPGFLRVSTTPWAVQGQTVAYAIWSATARRTDRLGSPGQPDGHAAHALFAPGTRFVVLDVSTRAGPPESPAGGIWVLLREFVGGRADPTFDERVRGRLQALVSRVDGDATPTPSGMAEDGGVDGSLIGLGDDGRPYAPEGGDVPPSES